MVKSNLIAQHRFDEITTLVQEAVQVMLGFEFAHLGINELSEEKAMEKSTLLADLFHFPRMPGALSVFAGPNIELTKSRSPGDKGHIAIATHDIRRAIFYLQRQAVRALPETEKSTYDATSYQPATYANTCCFFSISTIPRMLFTCKRTGLCCCLRLPLPQGEAPFGRCDKNRSLFKK